MRQALMFTGKRDLIEWMERELPEDAQFIAPGLLGINATAASARHPAPRLRAELVFPTDALTEHSPANDISWLVARRGRIRAFIPIIVAAAGTFQSPAEAAGDKRAEE